MAQKGIPGKIYCEYMIWGWNTALEELTKKKEKSESHGNSKFVPDFSFGDNIPYSQEDVRKILFGETVVGMVKENDLEEPLVLLFMWGYYLTMEGCSLDWAKKTTDTYINDKKYNIALGTGCSGNKSMTINGWHRIGRKMSVNSFQTQTRRDQQRK